MKTGLGFETNLTTTLNLVAQHSLTVSLCRPGCNPCLEIEHWSSGRSELSGVRVTAGHALEIQIPGCCLGGSDPIGPGSFWDMCLLSIRMIHMTPPLEQGSLWGCQRLFTCSLVTGEVAPLSSLSGPASWWSRAGAGWSRGLGAASPMCTCEAYPFSRLRALMPSPVKWASAKTPDGKG